jgi:hypothetical protein
VYLELNVSIWQRFPHQDKLSCVILLSRQPAEEIRFHPYFMLLPVEDYVILGLEALAPVKVGDELG